MSVVFLAVGSRGDVQPVVAVGRELAARGVPVTVVALRDFAGIVTSAGLRYEPVERSMDESIAAVGERAGAIARSGLAYTMGVRRWLSSIAPAVTDATLRAVGAGDLVVAGLLSFDDAAALRAAYGCRVLHVLYAPLLPTAYGPSALAAVRPGGVTRANRWAGAFALTAVAGMATTTGRHLRGRLGLRRTSARGFARLVRQTPTLVATSPVLVPPAPDWPAHMWSTGAWLETGPVDEPDTVLRGFVEAGPAPVFVGFGSMPGVDPAGDAALITAAVRKSGERAVIAVPGIDPSALPPSPGVLVVRSAPYRWLFPRTAAVIHHGGAGTTVEGLRAGAPTGVVTVGADQPYYGRRIEALHAGPPPLRRRDLTVDRLAALIAELTSGPYRAGAEAVSAALKEEHGAATAADHIVDHLPDHSGPAAPEDR